MGVRPAGTTSTESVGSSPRRSRSRPPTVVLEVLRLLVIVFFAGAGYEVGTGIGPDRQVLGVLNGTAVGLILGVGLGYVLGGVLGRTTTTSAEGVRSRLQETISN